MEFSYAQKYRTLYEKHWWWHAREKYILDLISKLQLPPEASILDIGCSDGLFFQALSKFGIPHGIEPDASLLSNNKWRNQIWHAPFDETFQTSQKFDLILMLDVLEHIENDQAALQKASQLLKSHGKIITTVPALKALWTFHDTLNHHLRRYKRSELMALFQSANLTCSFCRYYFIWTAIPKFAIHLKEKISGMPKANIQTTIPIQPINAFLTRLSYIEHRIFQTLPVPFGSSLIAIGSRQ